MTKHKTRKIQTELPSSRCSVILQALASLLSSDHILLLECHEVDSLYSILFSACDIIPQYHVTSQTSRVRVDHFMFLVECLTLAARLSIHVVSVFYILKFYWCVCCIFLFTSHSEDSMLVPLHTLPGWSWRCGSNNNLSIFCGGEL